MINSFVDYEKSSKMLLAVLPLMAVCNLCTVTVAAICIFLFSVSVTAVAIYLLKDFLIKSAVVPAAVLIAVGASGIAACVISVFAKEAVEAIGYYVAVIAVEAVFVLPKSNKTEITAKRYFAETAIYAIGAVTVLFASGLIREFFGKGSIFSVDVFTKWFLPIEFLASPAGGLFIAALFAIVFKAIFKPNKEREAAK